MISPKRETWLLAVLALLCIPSARAALIDVDVKSGSLWKPVPTQILENLPGYDTTRRDGAYDRFGGWAAGPRMPATGFFKTAQVDGRWWLVDPDGCLFLHKGVDAVAPGTSEAFRQAFAEKFGTETAWSGYVTNWMKQSGFNGAGAWSAVNVLRHEARPIVYTQIWNFMATYGSSRGKTYQQPGHLGYPMNAIFVFNPDFPAFCDSLAQQLAPTKDDPYLLGHFSDNELPWPDTALANYLSLPVSEPGYQAAHAWLESRLGKGATVKDATDADKAAFLQYQAETYYRIVAAAIRKYDPNHLFLGSRFHGSALRTEAVVTAAGKFADVVSFNWYGTWTPDTARMGQWGKWAGKPFLITEFYAKGDDVPGLTNTSGAGFLVRTQRDRGYFYQNFALGLIKSRNCVGWHWFKYLDNDPMDTSVDPSNRTSNKGIVNVKYQEYTDLTRAMEAVNLRGYSLTRFFAGKPDVGIRTGEMILRGAAPGPGSTDPWFTWPGSDGIPRDALGRGPLRPAPSGTLPAAPAR